MATYTGYFVTSEEFEEIKGILSSRFKIVHVEASNSSITESHDIIVSDGKFSMNYFQDKHLVIEGDQSHPYFNQIYQSVDNFLGTNRKPIVKNSNKTIKSSFTETPKSSNSSSNKPSDPKKMDEEIRKAKEDAIPRMIVNSPGETYAPNKGPHVTKSTRREISLPSKPKEVHFIHAPQSTFGKVAAICSIIGVPLAIFFGLLGMGIIDFSNEMEEPEINVTDLNALDGIVEGNKFVYSYEPRSNTPNGTKNEVFSLKISNTGNANAHNFWIIMDSKPDGLWFDFNDSAILHEGDHTPCQQKSSYCTIGLVPKDSSNMVVKYSVTFDHKLFQELEDESPKLLFKYDFDEGDEQTIEVQLKFD